MPPILYSFSASSSSSPSSDVFYLLIFFKKKSKILGIPGSGVPQPLIPRMEFSVEWMLNSILSLTSILSMSRRTACA
ncbi:MAG: hypothetical protein IKJ11_04765, partial [Clostridia bacterium]|nr:hypothetical protein [Clostridia bacterium]